MPLSSLLDILASTRQIATHAESKGIAVHTTPVRPVIDHIGAALADCILQAGLNYRTVVRPRVERIKTSYPLAANLSGVKAVIDSGQIADFLCWHHPEKLSRFGGLVSLLCVDDVEKVSDLRDWLMRTSARDRMLSLHGVGPKTFDYLCCIVGIDRIAVDRHVISFASEAGVSTGHYDDLQAVAADLLGMPRRDFDAWIWKHRARETSEPQQLALL